MSNPFDRNPFDLPPPWNPGYALPQNVDDEGLERHAYTTEWAPRRSFDNPKVGYAGYAVPEYVKEEGYGVGAMTTRWAPRGTYMGPKVPHWLDRPSARVIARTKLPGGATQLQIQAMAGIESAKTGVAAYTAYGLTSANALLDTVKMMPPAVRVKQLKKALDKIDPTLYSRAEGAASKESKVGVPADLALERGLAAAMSHGIATELVDLGRGKKPARRSQLGAVCYGCLAMLGDTAKPGYCWVDATPTVPAHWERARAGQDPATCAAQPSGGAPIVRTGTAGTKPAPTPPSPADQQFLHIGPFLIPVTAGAWRDHRPLPAEQKAYVDENIAIAAKAGGISIDEMKEGKYPFVKFQIQGDEWGLYYREKSGETVVSYHKTSEVISGRPSSGIAGAIRDVAETIGGAIAAVFKKIWAGIKYVTAKVVDFAKDAAEWVKDKACDLMTGAAGKIAGAAAGASVGGPAGAQAGAMGAQIAAQACASAPPPAPETPPIASGSSLMPLLLIGGAGLAAVLLLGKKS